MDGWMYVSMHLSMDGWMDGWMAGWAGGWVDEWMHVLMHAHKGICVHVHVFVRMHTCMQLMEIKRIENESDNHGDEEGSGHNEVMLFAPTMMFLITPMTMGGLPELRTVKAIGATDVPVFRDTANEMRRQDVYEFRLCNFSETRR
eukprot:s7249_g1.t1